MKRNQMRVLWAMLSVLLTVGCAGAPAEGSRPEIIKKYENVELVEQMRDVMYTHKLEGLDDIEEVSGDIVRGYLLDDSKELHYPEGAEDRDVTYGCTETTLQITEVYKGDLKAGDTICLLEEYYTLEFGGRKELYYFMNYFPCDTGREYLFFLSRPAEDGKWAGTYIPSFNQYSRYPVPERPLRIQDIYAMTDKELSLANGVSDFYMELYYEVIQKYLT